MPKYQILKALEYAKLGAKTKKQYPSAQAFYDAGWWLQMKYDGVFGKATLNPDGKHFMHSRTGEVITSANHILTALARAADNYAGSWDSFVVLGELWHSVLPFPTISGDVRRHAASPHLCFMANDLLPPEMVCIHKYEDRYKDLATLVNHAGPEIRLALRKALLDDMSVAQQAEAWVKMGGYDGAILRDPKAPYTIAEANLGQIIKVKPKVTLALRVCDIGIRAGEKTGRPVYTALVSYRGKETWIGAGMPHQLCDMPDLGVFIEVECLGLTADNALREPVYKGIRHDVLEQDK
jgi:DNA ligase-1